METVLSYIVSFIGTNIDNLFVIMLLYAQSDDMIRKRSIVIGQYIGIEILVGFSIPGAYGLNFIPQKYIGLLGLIPIALGIKEWVTYKKKGEKDVLDKMPGTQSTVFSVVLVSVANGADNIGVYIPLFTGYSVAQILITVTIFVLMMALWCFLGEKITGISRIKDAIMKYKNIAVPILFFALGIYIMIKAGLFGSP